MFGLLSIAERSSTIYWKVVLLPMAGILAFGAILIPATILVQILFNLLWKHMVSYLLNGWSRQPDGLPSFIMFPFILFRTAQMRACCNFASCRSWASCHLGAS